jgi:hypothetical protein
MMVMQIATGKSSCACCLFLFAFSISLTGWLLFELQEKQ